MAERKTRVAFVEDDFGVSVVVHGTHDIDAARKHALPVWDAKLGIYRADGFARPLPRGHRTWLRVRPLLPVEREVYQYKFWYEVGTPGKQGSFRAVEFTTAPAPMGTRAAEDECSRCYCPTVTKPSCLCRCHQEGRHA